MTRTRFKPAGNDQASVDQVAVAYVHRLFREFREPACLACPEEDVAAACMHVITNAAKKKGVATEIVDLRPAPPNRLGVVTASLRDINDRCAVDPTSLPPLLIMDGFDLLEGPSNDEPTYPFRSRFQFDREYLWLFGEQDWQRISRLLDTPTEREMVKRVVGAMGSDSYL